MSSTDAIKAAFSSDANLCDRVLAAARQNRDQLQLFIDVARYISTSQSSQSAAQSSTGPQPKKRKIEEPDHPVKQEPIGHETNGIGQALGGPTLLGLADISFSLPVRKKLQLELLGFSQAGLRVSSVSENKTYFQLALNEIEHAFCLPVPEKATRQQNVILLLRRQLTYPGAKAEDESYDQLLWTLPETAVKGVTAAAQGFEAQDGETYVQILLRCLQPMLAGVGKSVVMPQEKEFVSAIPQSHRKGEKGWHVKAFVGSKDGYLFLLSTGILWGYRKPLSFYPFDRIESISYTSVLQRTFNLVISAYSGQDSEQQEKTDVEFSMIDQADFAGIDDYIKRHGLNDASMAAERRAKKLNINGPRSREGGENGEVATNGEVADGGEEEESELQKAQQQLEDEEDEEEEDYDPGSEGDSEGEGEDSEEEEDGQGEDGVEYDEGEEEEEMEE